MRTQETISRIEIFYFITSIRFLTLSIWFDLESISFYSISFHVYFISSNIFFMVLNFVKIFVLISKGQVMKTVVLQQTVRQFQTKPRPMNPHRHPVQLLKKYRALQLQKLTVNQKRLLLRTSRLNLLNPTPPWQLKILKNQHQVVCFKFSDNKTKVTFLLQVFSRSRYIISRVLCLCMQMVLVVSRDVSLDAKHLAHSLSAKRTSWNTFVSF